MALASDPCIPGDRVIAVSLLAVFALLFLLAWASPADAFFLVPAVAAALAVSAVTATIIVGVASVALSVGISWASSKLFAKDPGEPTPEPSGGVQLDLRVDADIPQSLIVGRAVTAGSLVHAETYGKRGDIDNSDLIQIIALADHPITAIQETYVESQLVALTTQVGGSGTTGVNAANRGYLVIDRYDAKIAFGQYFGTQTTADAFAVAALGTHPERPWTAAMVGRGIAYVRVHTVYDREKMSGPLPCRFVVDGIKLYDPRFDSTVGGNGGDGSQRFDNLDTHTFTRNLAVIAYNILRGIRVKDSTGTPRHFYGLENTPAANLPLDNWFAAMNEADVTIDGEPQFHGGAEITIDTEPKEALRQIIRSCDGRLSELGGVYKLYLGAATLPAITFDDGVLRANEGETFKPILGLTQRVNFVTGKYTAPADGWVPKVAPPRADADMEIEDGRRLPADLDLPWVQFPGHMQRLQQQMLLRSRRERRHTVPLPPAAFGIEPGDIAEWNSDRNGYIDKLFEVDSVDLHANLNSTVSLIELDPDDYDWNPATDYIPQPVGSLTANRPAPKIIEGFDAEGIVHQGDNGIARAAIRVTWDAPEDGDIARVEIQVRRSALVAEPATFSTDEPAAEVMIILASVAPATQYEVRGRFISFNAYQTEWSLWEPVTTPDVRVLQRELSLALDAKIRQIDEQLAVGLRGLSDTLERVAQAVNSQVTSLGMTNGRSLISIGSRYGQNKASIEQVAIDVSDTEQSLAALLTDLTVNYETSTTTASARTYTQNVAIAKADIAVGVLSEEIETQWTTSATFAQARTHTATVASSSAAGAVAGLTTKLTTEYGTSSEAAAIRGAVNDEAIARSGADGALAGRLTTFLATGPGGSAEGRIRVVAASTASGAAASIGMEVNAAAPPTGDWRGASLHLDAMSSFTRVRMRGDLIVFEAPGVNGDAPFEMFSVGTVDGETVGILNGKLAVQKLVANSIDTQHITVGGVELINLAVGAATNKTVINTSAVSGTSGTTTFASGTVNIQNDTRESRAYVNIGNVSSTGGSVVSGGPGTFKIKIFAGGVERGNLDFTHDTASGANFTGNWQYTKHIQCYFDIPTLAVGNHTFELQLIATGTTTALPAGKLTVEELRR